MRWHSFILHTQGLSIGCFVLISSRFPFFPLRLLFGFALNDSSSFFSFIALFFSGLSFIPSSFSDFHLYFQQHFAIQNQPLHCIGVSAYRYFRIVQNLKSLVIYHHNQRYHYMLKVHQHYHSTHLGKGRKLIFRK